MGEHQDRIVAAASRAPYPPHMNRRALRRLAQAGTAISAVVILYATLTPSPPDPAGLPDWASHLLLFGALGVPASLWYATSEAARREPRRALAMVILALWLFGGATEVAQGPIPGRSPALADWAFDLVGAVAGFVGGGAAWRALLAR